MEKHLKLCLLFFLSSRTHKECLNNFFWPKILTTNTLNTNVHKMYECDKNQVPYCNVKNFKKMNFFVNSGSLIKHGPHWIKFIIFTIIIENNRYLDACIKLGTKLFHLT